MITGIALGVALAATGYFFFDLATTYSRLPARVPLHFDLSGKPGRYGPRWALSLILAIVEIALVADIVVSGNLVAPGGAAHATPIILAAITAFTAFTQHLIFGVALGRDRRLPPSFYVALIATLTLCVALNFIPNAS